MSQDLTKNLVLHLDMETLEDYSGNSNNGTATGTTLTTDNLNRLNKARSFDGVDDRINTNYNVDESNPFSISCLFKRNNFTGNQERIFTNMIVTDTNGFIVDILDTGVLRFYTVISGSFPFTDSSSGYDDGEWHYVCWTYDGAGTHNYYIDGVNIGTATSKTLLTSNTRGLTFGNLVDSSGTNDFGGDIYKGKAWSRELTSDEVLQDYNDVKGNYQGLFYGLVAGYDFRGDAKDFSGNGYDLTVNGATLANDRFGVNNHSYDFDGNDYLSRNSIPTNWTDFTIITMFKITTLGTDRRVVYFNNGTNAEFGFIRINASDQVVFTLVDNTTNVLVSDTALSTDTWYIVTCVRDSGTLRFYIDKTVQTSTGTDAGTLTLNTNLRIGSDTVPSFYLTGNVQFVHIYNRAFSSDEVNTRVDLGLSKEIYPYIDGGRK